MPRPTRLRSAHLGKPARAAAKSFVDRGRKLRLRCASRVPSAFAFDADFRRGEGSPSWSSASTGAQRDRTRRSLIVTSDPASGMDCEMPSLRPWTSSIATGRSASRDERFDGTFYVAVTIHRASAAARAARRSRRGGRTSASTRPRPRRRRGGSGRASGACPDASPGSPEWSIRGDHGRPGDAPHRRRRRGARGRPGTCPPPGLLRSGSVHRRLVAEVGAGGSRLARARRAALGPRPSRDTDLPATEIGFAAGFESVRQFNATMQEVFAASPSELRARRSAGGSNPRLARSRSDSRPGDRSTVPRSSRSWRRGPIPASRNGPETRTGGASGCPTGPRSSRWSPLTTGSACSLRLDDPRDLATAVARCRRLLDLDADPVAVSDALLPDPSTRPARSPLAWPARPGSRGPGRDRGPRGPRSAGLGCGARTLAGRLAERFRRAAEGARPAA